MQFSSRENWRRPTTVGGGFLANCSLKKKVGVAVAAVTDRVSDDRIPSGASFFAHSSFFDVRSEMKLCELYSRSIPSTDTAKENRFNEPERLTKPVVDGATVAGGGGAGVVRLLCGQTPHSAQVSRPVRTQSPRRLAVFFILRPATASCRVRFVSCRCVPRRRRIGILASRETSPLPSWKPVEFAVPVHHRHTHTSATHLARHCCELCVAAGLFIFGVAVVRLVKRDAITPWSASCV